MAKDVVFPRTRHVALSVSEHPEGADALLWSLASAEEEARQDPPAAAMSEALATGTQGAATAPQARSLPRVVVVEIGLPEGEGDRCRSLAGEPALVRCPSSLEGRTTAGDAAARGSVLGEAVLLSGLDRWYRLGPEGAGYCRSCELALVEALRENFGEHLQPFDALAGLLQGALPWLERPFARQKDALRLAEAVEAGKRAVLRARDEARAVRSLELAVLGRVGTLTAAALALCRHLDGLVFDLPSLDPHEALLPLLAARAALGQRPAVAVLPGEATPAQVRVFAALAAACDTDLLLSSPASAEARAVLAGHRKFVALVRERYRPSEPLIDAEILLSPRCDHFTKGAHQQAASAVTAALARAQLQPVVRLELSEKPRAQLLILAGAAALSPADAAAARRHVEGGGDLLLFGRAAAADDEGRFLEALFPEAKSGLERVGEGRVYALLDAPAATLEASLSRALRELAGKGRGQITVAGRGRLFTRAYLDAERKLDVHLVNLDLCEGGVTPAQGVQLSIAGQAAGGGRTGYFFSPERDAGRDGERITLNPSGFSVSTILTSVDAYALLAVPR